MLCEEKMRFFSRKIGILVLILSFIFPAVAFATSLWEDTSSSSSMFVDRKASRLNDIVTVLISEQTATARSADKSTGYDTSIDGKVESWFTISGVVDVVKSLLGIDKDNGMPGSAVVDRDAELKATPANTTNLPAWKLSASHEHKGSGAMTRKDSISARITCTIIEVLPNGNLVLEGQQDLTVDKDVQTIVFRGVVRPDDITPENMVYSYNVADAEIVFGGDGPIADKTKRGLIEAVSDFLWPF